MSSVISMMTTSFILFIYLFVFYSVTISLDNVSPKGSNDFERMCGSGRGPVSHRVRGFV